eukprot:3918914-Pleurochrysis_carterae.AAC.1
MNRLDTVNVIANRIDKMRLERDYKALKVYFVYEISFLKEEEGKDGEIVQTIEKLHLRSKPQVVLSISDVKEMLIKHVKDCFMPEQYGHIPIKFHNITCNIALYKPDLGGTYTELPKKVASKKAIVNIKNTDNYCFLYSVCAGLLPILPFNPHLPSKYDLSTLKYKEDWFTGGGLNVHGQQIAHFEKMND